MRTQISLVPASVCAALTSAAAYGATPVDSTFSYQDQLKENGSPVTNTSPGCDFTFSLWDAPSAGNQIGSTQTLNGVPVRNGVFTVELNAADEFGPDAFKDEQRWLEISVACLAGDPLEVLSPRQRLTAPADAMDVEITELRNEKDAEIAALTDRDPGDRTPSVEGRPEPRGRDPEVFLDPGREDW